MTLRHAHRRWRPTNPRPKRFCIATIDLSGGLGVVPAPPPEMHATAQERSAAAHRRPNPERERPRDLRFRCENDRGAADSEAKTSRRRPNDPTAVAPCQSRPPPVQIPPLSRNDGRRTRPPGCPRPTRDARAPGRLDDQPHRQPRRRQRRTVYYPGIDDPTAAAVLLDGSGGRELATRAPARRPPTSPRVRYFGDPDPLSSALVEAPVESARRSRRRLRRERPRPAPQRRPRRPPVPARHRPRHLAVAPADVRALRRLLRVRRDVRGERSRSARVLAGDAWTFDDALSN